jgi:non-canonical (house-cleaning) NTP pyrophosphatase
MTRVTPSTLRPGPGPALAPSLVSALSGSPICVGSENPAKLSAVKAAFTAFLAPDARLDLVSLAVSSGVPEQPIGFGQILTGARNRARAAFEQGDGVIAVGLEDGLVRLSDPPLDDEYAEAFSEASDGVYNLGCAWLTDGQRDGHGFSAAFSYPRECQGPAMRDQQPIGDLFDEYWRAHRPPTEVQPSGPTIASGRQGGNIGILTAGRLDRAAYGEQAILCALIRFLHTDLYD